MELLGTILLQEGLISPDKLEAALNRQEETGRRLGELLISEGNVTEQQVISALSKQLGLRALEEDQLIAIERETVALIPEFFAREYHVIAFGKNEEELQVVMSDPEDIVVLDNLHKMTSYKITPLLAPQRLIDEAIERHYRELRATGEVTAALSGLDFVISGDREEYDEIDVNRLKKEIEEAPVVKLVNLALTEAIKNRATDIHIEPLFDSLLIRYRIDGHLQEIMTAPKKSQTGIISRIKIMANLNIAERRLPQDGRFTIRLPDKEVDVRVSVIPTVRGEKVVLRLLDKGGFEYYLSKLGFEPDMLEIFSRWIKTPYGMIVVSGPTGCGKSTTLHAALNEIKSTEDNIVTVEDPVEYQIDKINQVATNDQIGLTFASSLRHILRQDPDKILIGEIRDKETGDIAIKFSLTGHLVLTTVHSNDAPSTITRMLDIGMPRFLVGSCVNLVMAQRLVRTVCPHCREPYEPTPEELKALKLSFEQLKEAKFVNGRGCVHCRNTGHYGRTGIFELLEMKPPIRRLIFDGANQEDIREKALELGMVTLRAAGIRKATRGETTIGEVLSGTIEEN
ncbi:MAG: pilus assembly protein PilB [candidate division Zixibacteria bacterium DG_27]|nr:MAG: pilus assembly protein PilB [candidate division Zixibacteria bacterium DG_27]